MKRKSDFFDIDPIFSTLDELLPVAENTINAAIAESNGHISRDQLQIAIIAGLSAFISTLGHGGAFDQGEKAAITIGKSLPHIIVAANKVNKEYANPKDRIFHILRTAAGLLSRAATSTLSGFLPEKRADIGKDIEIPILLVVGKLTSHLLLKLVFLGYIQLQVLQVVVFLIRLVIGGTELAQNENNFNKCNSQCQDKL